MMAAEAKWHAGSIKTKTKFDCLDCHQPGNRAGTVLRVGKFASWLAKTGFCQFLLKCLPKHIKCSTIIKKFTRFLIKWTQNDNFLKYLARINTDIWLIVEAFAKFCVLPVFNDYVNCSFIKNYAYFKQQQTWLRMAKSVTLCLVRYGGKSVGLVFFWFNPV